MRDISSDKFSANFRMLKILWSDLNHEIISSLENEEWVQVPYEKKQQVLQDLRNPENMETVLRYNPGYDMINFKIYRPDGLTKMAKFTMWALIPGISEKIAIFQKSDGRKSV